MVMITDRATLAPACCMVCRSGRGPVIDFGTDTDNPAAPTLVEHLYLCAACVRDLARMMSEQRQVGWLVASDADVDAWESRYAEAHASSTSLAETVAEQDKVISGMTALMDGKTRRIAELEAAVAGASAQAQTKGKKS